MPNPPVKFNVVATRNYFSRNGTHCTVKAKPLLAEDRWGEMITIELSNGDTENSKEFFYSYNPFGLIQFYADLSKFRDEFEAKLKK